MRWIESLDDADPAATAPCAWIVSPGGLAPRPAPRPEDLAHAARRRDPERRAATLERRLRLRALAARLLGSDAAEVVVAQPPRGAPRISAPRPLHAAVAGRNGWSLVVVSPIPVGADVERVEPGAHRPLDLLHPALAERLDAADDLAFARAWAAAEAHLKLTGEGVARLGEVLFDGESARSVGGGSYSRIDFERRGEMVLACATPALEER